MATNTFLLSCFVFVDMFKELILDNQFPESEEYSKSIPPSKESDSKTSFTKECYNYLDGCPLLIQAISRNQLMYFLLANILTGIVNIYVNTIHTNWTTSLLILVLYLVVLNGFTVYLHLHNITTKIW